MVPVIVIVRAHGHDGDEVAAQLGDSDLKTCVYIDRPGIDAIVRVSVAVDIRFTEVRDIRVVRRIAGPVVGIAGGNDENSRVAVACLRQGGNGIIVIGAELGFAVMLDDARKADTHVDEIQRTPAARPVDDVGQQGRPTVIVVVQGSEGYGAIVAAAPCPRGDRKHGDVGTPGDAARCSDPVGVRVARRARHDHTCDRGAVRPCIAGLLDCAQEQLLVNGPPTEQRMSFINSGIEEADGLAAARCRANAQRQLQLCPGAFCTDCLQPPLVLKILLTVVREFDLLQLLRVLRLREAAQDCLRAIGRRWRRWWRRWWRGWGWWRGWARVRRHLRR